MAKAADGPTLTLKDYERSAYGLGWESRRRGRALKANPFPGNHWKHQEFIRGWRAYRPFIRGKKP